LAEAKSFSQLRHGRANKQNRENGMSWKVEVIMDDTGEWEGDTLRFVSEQEALAYARDLEFRCSAVREKRIRRSEDPANHRWTTRGVRLIHLPNPAS
jgi:hypothetical protein